MDSSFSFGSFATRHLGDNADQTSQMLQLIGYRTLNELISDTVPENIRLKNPLNFPAAQSEFEFINSFKEIAKKNKIYKSYIGVGYYPCITPPVILRNVLENPSWYTAYTPYQAEIAQGRLEMLINFQTMVIELTGMEIANASLLDEATAAGEAMSMMLLCRANDKKSAQRFLVANTCHAQTIDVVQGRAKPLDIVVEIVDFTKPQKWNDVFGILVQYPDTEGVITNYADLIAEAHSNNALVCMATDLLALTHLTSPGELGADIAVGSAQRFGVPMGYGGPHAAFFATKDAFKRQMPGRIIGISVDAQGNKAYRMSLQTREQHIRRDKATSNICTSQVLLAVMAASYAVYHGADGLKNIALRVHSLAKSTALALNTAGLKTSSSNIFDTICFQLTKEKALELKKVAETKEVNFRYFDDGKVSLSFDETTSLEDLKVVESIFTLFLSKEVKITFQNHEIAASLTRKTSFMQADAFTKHRTEHEMLRYLKKLESKDLSMVHSMISLGSCTMKLNSTTEMIPVTWPEFGNIHPFAPLNQAEGYAILFQKLSAALAEITGFEGVSLQPNSGAQGEYAGLMVIRAFHGDNGEHGRNVALIPSSAHGTNPASAILAGMKVVVVKCDEVGNIDVADLKRLAEEYKYTLSCLMVTYPSTHGVFEESIIDICAIIHKYGGQVYMDGANMNAQVGLTSPANIGADVCHLNLHKTFCIPHGGGGPGMGPICVAKHLVPFLPNHSFIKGESLTHAVSAAPWGSASILPISYSYICLMGGEGLKLATEYAIMNANYIRKRLSAYYSILYTGTHGNCAHELILDCRSFKLSTGVEVEDIAKRLMDYGFHAPTVSFPVAGTLMIEPTESESKEEIDRLCDALIEIRNEIAEIENGTADAKDNVLKNAPHTVLVATADVWEHAYARSKAIFPLEWVRDAKFWPSVGRIDNAYGDRNLVCSCSPIENYV